MTQIEAETANKKQVVVRHRCPVCLRYRPPSYRVFRADNIGDLVVYERVCYGHVARYVAGERHPTWLAVYQFIVNDTDDEDPDVTVDGIKGGQGRSGAEVRSSAAATVVFILVGIAVGMIVVGMIIVRSCP